MPQDATSGEGISRWGGSKSLSLGATMHEVSLRRDFHLSQKKCLGMTYEKGSVVEVTRKEKHIRSSRTCDGVSNTRINAIELRYI